VEQEKFVDFTIGNSQLSLRPEVESSVPFGITTYQTTGAIRDIKLRMLENKDLAPPTPGEGLGRGLIPKGNIEYP
jgi:hypothetical protein